MLLKFKQYALKEGHDREITARRAAEILGVRPARLSQLKAEGLIDALEQTRQVKKMGRPNTMYSLRMVIELALSYEVNKAKQGNGKAVKRNKRKAV